MQSRWARVARGWAAAAFATFVAALSHTLAGGATPSAFGILASLVLSGMVCSLLAGRTLSLWRLTASVAISQMLFHGLFVSMGTPVAAAHSMIMVSTSPLLSPGLMAMDVAPATHALGALMVLAHVIAALTTLVAFRYAEHAFWRMADIARLALARLTQLVVPLSATPVRFVVLPDARELPAAFTYFVNSMSRRGPPVECA